MSNFSGEKLNSRLHMGRSHDQYKRGMPQFFAQTFDRSGLNSARPIFSIKNKDSISERIVSELSRPPKKTMRLALALGVAGGLAAVLLVGAKLTLAMQADWNVAAIFIVGGLSILACCVTFVLVSEGVRKIAIRKATHKVELPMSESDMMINLRPQCHAVRRYMAQDSTRSNLG